jgi:hypothetical protein
MKALFAGKAKWADSPGPKSELNDASVGWWQNGQTPESFLTNPKRYSGVWRVSSKPVASAPPIFKPQPLSVGVFSYVLPPDPANMRGTLSRLADFDSPAASLPLATWRSLRAIPLSFLSGSKLPEVRRRHGLYPINGGHALTRHG